RRGGVAGRRADAPVADPATARRRPLPRLARQEAGPVAALPLGPAVRGGRPVSRRARDDRPVVLACVSDLHAGSTVGLCPASGIDLDDGGRYEPSKAQRWLWQCWREYWDEVARERDASGAALYVVLHGDVIDGAHHGTTQIVSGNLDVQGAVARACLEVPRALGVDRWFVVRGTEAHVGPSAQAEEGIARWLGAERDRDTGTYSWWHLRLLVHDVLIDAAHHGRTGYR